MNSLGLDGTCQRTAMFCDGGIVRREAGEPLQTICSYLAPWLQRCRRRCCRGCRGCVVIDSLLLFCRQSTFCSAHSCAAAAAYCCGLDPRLYDSLPDSDATLALPLYVSKVSLRVRQHTAARSTYAVDGLSQGTLRYNHHYPCEVRAQTCISPIATQFTCWMRTGMTKPALERKRSHTPCPLLGILFLLSAFASPSAPPQPPNYNNNIGPIGCDSTKTFVWHRVASNLDARLPDVLDTS